VNNSMRAVAVGLLAILLIPVLATALRRPEPRSYQWVRLDDTRYRPIEFRNAGAGLELHGLLFAPTGPGTFPGVVVIPGSGPSRRDNGWYLTLVDDLQRHGIAVLLPDKRGSGESQGDWHTASFDDLAADAEAAIDFLRHRSGLQLSRVGVIGLSQGGQIAPLVADRYPGQVDFVVNVVGAALPMHETLVYEEKNNLREIGVLPVLADLLAYPSAWSIIWVRQRPFWRAIGNFDPLPCWRRLSVPSLSLYGENDANVPARASAARLRALGNPNVSVIVFPGSGHALESPPGSGRSIFRPDALEAIRRFVFGHE
jgi:pimeloyl-ACP methyl ester carboxylesterase